MSIWTRGFAGFVKEFGKGTGGILTFKEMQQFEAENALSEEKRRYLAFGAVLMSDWLESSRVFKLTEYKKPTGLNGHLTVLKKWGITNGDDAKRILQELSVAHVDAPVANEIYHTFIKNNPFYATSHKKRLDKETAITMETLLSAQEGLQRSFERVREEFHISFDTARWVFSFDEIKLMKKQAGTEEDLTEEGIREVLILPVASQHLLRVINESLSNYRVTKYLLIESSRQTGSPFKGYSEADLAKIETFEAYDLGRVVPLARLSVHAGFLKEEETWEYIKTAADTASQLYDSWETYLAAYVIGRHLVRSLSRGEFGYSISPSVVEYLLHHHNSPFREHAFKEPLIQIHNL